MTGYIIYRGAIEYRIEYRNQVVGYARTMAEVNAITGGNHILWR